MRLTGGQSRGRRLKRPRTAGLRPTPSRVREALFDILGARVRGASFLDLYAGTGAVGVEALSRGARRAVFVERDHDAVRVIEENLSLGVKAEAGEILDGDVATALESLRQRGDRFDIVFLDPPYDPGLPAAMLEAASTLVVPDGLLVVEHPRRKPLAQPEGSALRPGRVYHYGDTTLTVLHRLAPPEGA